MLMAKFVKHMYCRGLPPLILSEHLNEADKPLYHYVSILRSSLLPAGAYSLLISANTAA